MYGRKLSKAMKDKLAESRKEATCKKVYMYNSNYELVKVFNSRNEALKFLNLKGHTGLIRAIKNRTIYKNHFWSNELIESVETIETTSDDGRE